MSASAASAPEPDRRTDGQSVQGGAAGQPAPPPAPAPDGHQAPASPPPRAGQAARASDVEHTPPPAAPADRSPSGAPPVDRSQQRRDDPHADFLITSADRDAAEARLRQAVADDVIDLDEFGDRMRAVLEARTRGDLQRATAGIPAAAEPLRRTRERGVARPAREQGFVVAIMSGTETRGRWRPAPETTALAVMGGTVIDLQGAEFDGDVLTINALALMGAVEIVVPEGIEVELSGFAVMGGRDDRTRGGTVLPDTPLVRVQAYALMGDVEIRHPRKRDLRHVDDSRGAFADRVPLRSTDHVHTTHDYDEHQSEQRQKRRQRSRALATVRRWASGLLAAAVIALPVGWVLSSDDVAGAVFGGNEHIVNTQGLEAGDEMTVGAPVAFGGVSIIVPEGVRVEKNGVVIFGGSDCAACADQVAADAPTVQVRTLGAFGSVEVERVGAADAGLDD